MKNLIYLFLVVTLMFSCKNNAQSSKKDGFTSYGKIVTYNETATVDEVSAKYKTLKVGDTLNVKFKSKIEDVCQNKGCWMKITLADKQQSFVKFKDYAFFMPKDSKGQEVVVNGKAFVSEVSVDEQKHYAEDKGESKEAIAAIVAPKLTYSFLADGVLLLDKK